MHSSPPPPAQKKKRKEKYIIRFLKDLCIEHSHFFGMQESCEEVLKNVDSKKCETSTTFTLIHPCVNYEMKCRILGTSHIFSCF